MGQMEVKNGGLSLSTVGGFILCGLRMEVQGDRQMKFVWTSFHEVLD